MIRPTDWDAYYDQPYKTAHYSRRITLNLLVRIIRKYGNSKYKAIRIAELGGANSCFYNGIVNAIEPKQYYVIDNCELGHLKMTERVDNKECLVLIQKDVRKLQSECLVDLTFSVGLIEHFSIEDTKKAIDGHFAILNPGGVAILAFPTPTWLYRISRLISESLGMWIFHDERPLRLEEVAPTIEQHGNIIFTKINWPIFFTQLIIVARKKGNS